LGRYRATAIDRWPAPRRPGVNAASASTRPPDTTRGRVRGDASARSSAGRATPYAPPELEASSSRATPSSGAPGIGEDWIPTEDHDWADIARLPSIDGRPAATRPRCSAGGQVAPAPTEGVIDSTPSMVARPERGPRCPRRGARPTRRARAARGIWRPSRAGARVAPDTARRCVRGDAPAGSSSRRAEDWNSTGDHDWADIARLPSIDDQR
jgi:hypothetical protein